MRPQGRFSPPHPVYSRRDLLHAGALGVMGLSLADVAALGGHAAPSPAAAPARAVIYIFLSGGAPQHDTFDLKPDAPEDIRGEFNPIATRTVGVHICEHLPRLAQRSRHWALVRSLSHPHNGHQHGTMAMLTGRTAMPPGFRTSKPQASDWPAMAAVAGYATRPRHNLPPAVVLPEKIVLPSQGVFPGQFAGMLGQRYDPWFVEATTHPHGNHSFSGAYPGYLFNLHAGRPSDRDDFVYRAPHLALPEGMIPGRLTTRRTLLHEIDRQRRDLERVAEVANLDRYRQGAIALLSNPRVRWAFDVTNADLKTQERYGANSFGWSLLMARRLIEAGVNLVQVNLGNMGSWDLHGNNFPMLKDYLLPPTDRGVSALLDDLEQSGLLDSTLVVMAGEFGRTPRIFNGAPNVYRLPGRDHWGPVQTIWCAGGGVRGGSVIGASDRLGAFPASALQTPENFAATIYHALGIPRTAHWHDAQNRPFPIYHADPIQGLMG